MSFSTSPRLYVVVFIVAFSVVTAMTVVFTRSEVASFRDNHSRIFANDLSKAKVAIETFLSDRVRLVEAFALEKNAQLNDYLDHPHDLRRRAEIGASLLRWFPSHFTFTIADRDGEDLVDDIEGFVGDVCKRGIIAFMFSLRPAQSGLKFGQPIAPKMKLALFPMQTRGQLMTVAVRGGGADVLNVRTAPPKTPDRFFVLAALQGPDPKLIAALKQKIVQLRADIQQRSTALQKMEAQLKQMMMATK